jgi:hypothetical protein
MRRLFALAFLLSSAVTPSSALAQTALPPEEEGEGQICILIAYRWNGSPDEVRQIQEQPVPQSYVGHKSGACGGRAFPEDIVRWHLLFGSEDTVKEALQFIEKRDGSATGIAAKLKGDLTKALAKLDDELATEDESDDSRLDVSKPEKLGPFIANTPSVNDLRMLKNRLHFELLDRVHLYLSAAEIFQSKPLATQAQKLFALHQEIEAKLLPPRDGGGDVDIYVSKALEYVQDSSSPDLTSMEIDLRLAVLDAQLDPTPQTLNKASQVLERRRTSVYTDALTVAFEGGDDFCDLDDREQAIINACRNDNAFVSKAMAYGYADAMLAILTDFSGRWDWQDYVVLHQQDMIHDSELFSSLTGPDERVVDLKLAVADRNVAKVKAGEKGNWSYERAWQLLSELTPLANPAQNPVRFRKIAERAIAVDAEMQKDDSRWQKGHAQLLAYYRLNLDNLDKLASGQIR